MIEKFNYAEFSSEDAVKTLKKTESIDEKIINVLIDHFDNILGEISPENSSNESIDEVIIPARHQAIFSEEEISSIKTKNFEDGYAKGYQECKSSLDSEILELKNQISILQTMPQKLNQHLPTKEPISDYVDLISLFLEEFCDKLALALPTDFSAIIKKQLKHLLESGYVSGNIFIRVNQKNLDIVEKIIKNEEITSKFTNIEVIPDISLPESDCIVEYQQAKLLYDKVLVKNEVDEIIRQFKQDSL
jgi:flagellar biosynthesis/type III secretory pathway protein FliH